MSKKKPWYIEVCITTHVVREPYCTREEAEDVINRIIADAQEYGGEVGDIICEEREDDYDE